LKQTQNATPTNTSQRGLAAIVIGLASLLGACAGTGTSQAPAPISAGSSTNAADATKSIKAPAAPKLSDKAGDIKTSATAKRPASPAIDRTVGTAPPVAAAPVNASPVFSAIAPGATVTSSAAVSAVSASTTTSAEAETNTAKESGAIQAQAETASKLNEGTSPPQLSPAEEKDLWERIRRGFSMPELDTPLVADKERSYLAQPAYLQRMMARGGRYLFFIVEELERRNMPTELALLPFVESAMNPVAISSAKASGLWQFIPSTGRAYALNQNWWVDNRRDVVKSTHAALDYLQKIYAMHGNDWFLALASYNWGEGSVGRAVKSAKAKGLSGDYLSLSMPNETRHYVPKLLALKHIVQRSEELNVSLPVMLNKPYFVTIEKTRPIDLKLAAKFAGMTVDEFVGLNPAHNRPVIAASKNNEIKLPADRVESFLEAVKKHSDDNLVMASWQPYTVKPGETLGQVAQRGGVPEAEIRKANGLRAEAKILPGTNLLVPHAQVADERKVESFVAPRVYEQVNVPGQYHTVGKKENVATIARRYGLSVASLKAWNGIKKTAARGMNLLVRPAYAQTVLTAESGQRQVVSSTAAARATPVAVKVEEVEEVAEKAKPAPAVRPAISKSAKAAPVSAKREKVAAGKTKEVVKTKVVSKGSVGAKPVAGSKGTSSNKGQKVADPKAASGKNAKSVKTKADSKADTKVAKETGKKSKKV
jgi:membrane-bound lytic murein transglycosylase D